MTELLFQTLYFLNTRTFFKAVLRFRKSLYAFPEDAFFWNSRFWTVNLVFTVTLSIYHLVINHAVFRLKLAKGAPRRKSFY